jgi:hypothetical protein
MVAGVVLAHYATGDRMAEAHAMVSLVEQGWADQSEVARAFGWSARTVRRDQRRYEDGGLAALPERLEGLVNDINHIVRVGFANVFSGEATEAEGVFFHGATESGQAWLFAATEAAKDLLVGCLVRVRIHTRSVPPNLRSGRK